jgi:hypothetical protein
MPEPEDRPPDDPLRDRAPGDAGDGRSEPMERAATLVLRVWREGEGRDRQLKARLMVQVRAGLRAEPLESQYAAGIDGIVARVRAWLVAFDRDR